MYSELKDVLNYPKLVVHAYECLSNDIIDFNNVKKFDITENFLDTYFCLKKDVLLAIIESGDFTFPVIKKTGDVFYNKDELKFIDYKEKVEEFIEDIGGISNIIKFYFWYKNKILLIIDEYYNILNLKNIIKDVENIYEFNDIKNVNFIYINEYDKFVSSYLFFEKKFECSSFYLNRFNNYINYNQIIFEGSEHKKELLKNYLNDNTIPFVFSTIEKNWVGISIVDFNNFFEFIDNNIKSFLKDNNNLDSFIYNNVYSYINRILINLLKDNFKNIIDIDFIVEILFQYYKDKNIKKFELNINSWNNKQNIMLIYPDYKSVFSIHNMNKNEIIMWLDNKLIALKNKLDVETYFN